MSDSDIQRFVSSGTVVSPRQFKAALVDEGIWPAVFGAMSALEDSVRDGSATAEQIKRWLWWTEATEFVDGHPELVAAAAEYGLTPYLPAVFARAARA